MLHTYVDPFAVNPDDDKRVERQSVRRTIGVLNAEIDRLEMRIDRLWLQQGALPYDYDHSHEAEAYWDEVWNTYEWRIGRLIQRSNAMADTVFDLEARLYWKLS